MSVQPVPAKMETVTLPQETIDNAVNELTEIAGDIAARQQHDSLELHTGSDLLKVAASLIGEQLDD